MIPIPADILYKGLKYPDVRRLLEILNESIFLFDMHHNYKNDGALFKGAPLGNLKPNENTTEYQYEEQGLRRSHKDDRRFPLETIRLDSHRLTHNVDLERATIHIGPAADEYARSLNALAVTMATDIFFRNGAYRPESEEGRKILAHELTHVAQYTEGRITNTSTARELEEEAEEEEAAEEYDPDPIEEVEIGGELFRLRQSEQQEIIKNAVAETERWFAMQKDTLGTNDYFRLLRAYRSLKEGI